MPVPYSRRAMIRLGARVSMGAVLLAACGKGNGARSILSDTPGGPSGKRAGSVRIGQLMKAADPVGIGDAVYSRLVVLDPRKGKVYGDLARGLEVTPDGLVATVKLRDGLRFHPNKDNLAAAVTAEDVRRDFAARAESGEYLFAAAVGSIEASDVHTVVLRMKAPFSLLFDYLADASTGGVRSFERYKDFDAALGSGPFVPVAREDLGVAMVANPLFYRKHQPQLDRLQLIDGGPPVDLAAAVAAGELEVALHPPDAPDTQTQPPKGSMATTIKRTSRRMRGLGFSLVPQKGGGVQTRAVPAMQDARVRKAVSLAIDRAAIAAIDGGTISGPIGPAHAVDALPAEELTKNPLYQYDPGQAKQLLAAAGKGEIGFSLEGANRPTTRAVAQLIEKQLREVGFAPRTRLLPVADWEQLFLAGDFEGALVELDDMRTPDLGLRLHTSGGVSGSYSLWGFSDPLFDAAARKVFLEVDPMRRGERARAAQRVLLDEVPAMLPLAAPPDYATVAPSLRGYEFDAFEFNEAWNASIWRIEAKK